MDEVIVWETGADILKLPTGTQFYVLNGEWKWRGVIIEHNGCKYIKNDYYVLPIDSYMDYNLRVNIVTNEE